MKTDILHPHTNLTKHLFYKIVRSKEFLGNKVKYQTRLPESVQRNPRFYKDDGFHHVRADGFQFYGFPELDKTYRNVSALSYKNNSEFIQGETQHKPVAEIGHATKSITGPLTA